MRRIVFCLLFFSFVGLGLPSTASAESPNQPRSFMVGLQAMVTAEENVDGVSTIGINVAPLVLEYAFTYWIGLRAFPIVNLDVADGSAEIAQVGGAATIPLYYWGTEPSDSWYVGPFAGYSTNNLTDGSDFTLAAEGGFRWIIVYNWTLNLAIQFGASRLESASNSEWVNHFGLYPSVGYWAF